MWGALLFSGCGAATLMTAQTSLDSCSMANPSPPHLNQQSISRCNALYHICRSLSHAAKTVKVGRPLLKGPPRFVITECPFLGILLQGFQLESSCLSAFRQQPLLNEKLDFGAEEGAVDVVLLLPQPGEEGARHHRRSPVDRRLQLLRLLQLAHQLLLLLDQRGLQK